MPPACRALGNGDSELLPGRVLEDFLTAVVDRFVRQAGVAAPAEATFRRDGAASSLRRRFSMSDGCIRCDGKDTSKGFGTSSCSGKLQFDEEQEAPFRIAFRLEPPTPAEGSDDGSSDEAAPEGWELRFFLQALDDESLLVPLARDLGARRDDMALSGASTRAPARNGSRGARPCCESLPTHRRELETSRPESCSLDLDQAYTFLTGGAFLLKESGYGVLVPTWWGKREHGVGLSCG